MRVQITIEVEHEWGPEQDEARVLNGTDNYLWRHVDQCSFLIDQQSAYRMSMTLTEIEEEPDGES